MTLMTQAEFARHLGHDPSHITRLKQKGLLVMQGAKVDVEASEKRIEQLKDPSKQGVIDRHAEERAQKQSGDIVAGVHHSNYQDARAKKEHFAALQAQIAYEREIGLLLKVDDAKSAVADGDAIIRNRLESLPDILAPQLAAETDEQKIRILLIDYIEHMLSDLSRSFYGLMK